MTASSNSSQTSLFRVYLRLRPPMSQQDAQRAERFLTVEPPECQEYTGENPADAPIPVPTHITLHPPSDNKKRAVEKFAFTKVFEETSSQLELFQDTQMDSLLSGVLLEGRDGLVATLGVTGSGKSHTMLGSKSERGIIQMGLDVIYQSLSGTAKPQNSTDPSLLASISAADPSEPQLFPAHAFIEAVYGDPSPDRGRNSRTQTPASRSQTPLTVGIPRSRNSLKKPLTVHPSTIGTCLQRTFGAPAKADNASTNSPTGRHTPNISPTQTFKKTSLLSPASLSSPHTSGMRSTLAKLRDHMIKEPVPALLFPRRHALHPPNILPRVPDVSHLAMELDPNSEYVVLLSMYEVYNDRIFDLLSPALVPGQGSTFSRQAANGQKDRRRPLFFKFTEGSQDRKVVAGLRKIVCRTYEEALAVLEVGITERKVSGTGSNSVSSRSHGFFCIEVKKKTRGRRHGEETWVGNALTVVDLAGSERARNAKTTGSTLAEAGKINESLMYLGQCLQMQNNFQDGNKAALVPFRQCKLTELLFSNSFPSSNQNTASHGRRPQKGLMILAADPLGDFNATSQMLRYSALAKEVTVPRVPSVNETVMSGPLGAAKRISEGSRGGSPKAALKEELDAAAAHISRVTDECESLAVRVAEEEIARSELELRLRAAEGRNLIIEQEIREEAWAEMEERVEEERRKWQNAWADQANRNDEHLDKKIDLFSKGIQIYEDPEPSTDEKMEEIEHENSQLRSKVASLERELMNRSPTKKSKSSSKKNESSNLLCRESDVENALQRMDQLKLTESSASSRNAQPPAKRKQRKMATRRWDLAPEDQI